MTEPWIGVLGTLIGVVVGGMLTFVFTRRNQISKALHESRIASFSKFGAAVMEYRRTLMDRWFSEAGLSASMDNDSVYKARSAAWAALFEVQLVARAESLRDLATAAVDATASIKDAGDRDELAARADDSRRHVNDFIRAARGEVVAGSRVL